MLSKQNNTSSNAQGSPCASPGSALGASSGGHGYGVGKDVAAATESTSERLGWSQALKGEGNGTPLQYSLLENPMDGGAWRAAVHGVA